MDFRKILTMFLLIAAGAAGMSAQDTGFSFGALDVISGSGGNSLSSGALDEISRDLSASSQGQLSMGALDAILSSQPESSDGMLSALAMVSDSREGEYRSGPLNFISNVHSSGGYYMSGTWENSLGASMGGHGGINTGWIGQVLPAPAWGRITSGFGYRPRFGRMHKGIDIAMSVGDTVCVPLPGVVDRINYEAGGYGHYIVVKHDDGLETRYAHLSATLVAPGDRLMAHQPIALSGNTGNSTGPHLHFETRLLGSAIDPQSIFDFAGGMMSPKAQFGVGRQSFRATAGGALDRVAQMGTPGRSLQDKRTYVVRAGDTLQKIAARAGMSVNELCRLNFISETESLTPGTMLKLHR